MATSSQIEHLALRSARVPDPVRDLDVGRSELGFLGDIVKSAGNAVLYPTAPNVDSLKAMISFGTTVNVITQMIATLVIFKQHNASPLIKGTASIGTFIASADPRVSERMR